MIKKSLLQAFIISISLIVVLAPIGAIGHDYKFILSYVLYSLSYIFLIKKGKTSDLSIILILTLPVIAIYFPIHFYSFQETLISLPSSLSPLLGVAFGRLLFRNQKTRLIIVSIMLATIIYTPLYGYKKWVHYINYGSFDGESNYTMPDISLIDQESNPLKKEIFLNNVVILDFWNTSCGACFQKFPNLQKLSDKFINSHDTLVYSVNIPLKRDTINQSYSVLKRYDYTFSNLVSYDSLVIKKLGIKYFPTALLIKNGIVVYQGSIDKVESFIQNK